MDEQAVSIWTTAGRLRGVRFVCSEQARKLLAEHRKGESDLVHRDGMWFLIATCEVPEAEPYEPTDFLGVDLGIVNIATTSDGRIHAGRELNRYRKRQLALRAKLQKKGTKSAKRVLKRQRRKEQRKATEVNHIISKRIVTEAERTGRGIGMEDLAGIRRRVRLRKPGGTSRPKAGGGSRCIPGPSPSSDSSWSTRRVAQVSQCCSSTPPTPPAYARSAGTQTG
jgi:transposase